MNNLETYRSSNQNTLTPAPIQTPVIPSSTQDTQDTFIAGTRVERQLRVLQKRGVCDENCNLSPQISQAEGFNHLSDPWITAYAAEQLNAQISVGGRHMRFGVFLSAIIATAKAMGTPIGPEGIHLVGRDPISHANADWVDSLFQQAAAVVPEAKLAIVGERSKRPPEISVGYRIVAPCTTWEQVKELTNALHEELSKLYPECDSMDSEARVHYILSSGMLEGYKPFRYEEMEEGFIYTGVKTTGPNQKNVNITCGNKYKDTLFNKTNFHIVILPESIQYDEKGRIDESKLTAYVQSDGCNVLKALFEHHYSIINERPNAHYNEQAIFSYLEEILLNGWCSDEHLLGKLVQIQVQEPYRLASITYNGVVKLTKKVIHNPTRMQVAAAMMLEFALCEKFDKAIDRQINRMWSKLVDEYQVHPLANLRVKGRISSQFIITSWIFGGLIKLGFQSSKSEASQDSNVSMISYEKQPALQLKLDASVSAYAQFKLHFRSICEIIGNSIDEYIPAQHLDLLLEEAIDVISLHNLPHKKWSDDSCILQDDLRIWKSFDANQVLKHAEIWLCQKHPYYHFCATAMLYAFWKAHKNKQVQLCLCLNALPKLESTKNQKLLDLCHIIQIEADFELKELDDAVTYAYMSNQKQTSWKDIVVGKSSTEKKISREDIVTKDHTTQDIPRAKESVKSQEIVQEPKREVVKQKIQKVVEVPVVEVVPQEEELDPVQSIIEKLSKKDSSLKGLEPQVRKEIDAFCTKEVVTRKEFRIYSELCDKLPNNWKNLRTQLTDQLLKHLNINNYKISSKKKQLLIVSFIKTLLQSGNPPNFSEQQSRIILTELTHLTTENFNSLQPLLNSRMNALLEPLNKVLANSPTDKEQKEIVQLLTTHQSLMNEQQQQKCAKNIFMSTSNFSRLHLQKWLPLLNLDALSNEECGICWQKASYLVDVLKDIRPSLLFVLKELAKRHTANADVDKERLLKLVQACHQHNLLNFEETRTFAERVSCPSLALEVLQEQLEEEALPPQEIAQHLLVIAQNNPLVVRGFQETLLLPLFHKLAAEKDLKALEIATLIRTKELTLAQKKAWNKVISAFVELIPADSVEKRREVASMMIYSGTEQQQMLITSLKKEVTLQSLKVLQTHKKKLSTEDSIVYVDALRTSFINDDATETVELIFNDKQGMQLELCKLWMNHAPRTNESRERALEWLFRQHIETQRDSHICLQIAQQLLNDASGDAAWQLFCNFRRLLSAKDATNLDDIYLIKIFSEASKHIKGKILQQTSKWENLPKNISTYLSENDPFTVEDALKEQPISLARLNARCQRKANTPDDATWDLILPILASQQEEDTAAKELYNLWKKSSCGNKKLIEHLQRAPQLGRTLLVSALRYEDHTLLKSSYSALSKVVSILAADVKETNNWQLYLDYVSYCLERYTEAGNLKALFALGLESDGRQQLINLFMMKITSMKENEKQVKNRCMLLEYLFDLVNLSDHTDPQTQALFQLFFDNLQKWPVQHITLEGHEKIIRFLVNRDLSNMQPRQYVECIHWIASTGIIESSKANNAVKYFILDILDAFFQEHLAKGIMNQLANNCNRVNFAVNGNPSTLAVYVGHMLAKAVKELNLSSPYMLVNLLTCASGEIWYPTPNQRKKLIADWLIRYDQILKDEPDLDAATIKRKLKENDKIPEELTEAILPEFKKMVLAVQKRIPHLLCYRMCDYAPLVAKMKEIWAQPTDLNQRKAEISRLIKNQLKEENIKIIDLMSKHIDSFEGKNRSKALNCLSASIIELFAIFGDAPLCINKIHEVLQGFTELKSATNDLKTSLYLDFHALIAQIVINQTEIMALNKPLIYQELMCNIFWELINEFVTTSLSTPQPLFGKLEARANEYLTHYANIVIAIERNPQLCDKMQDRVLSFYKRIKESKSWVNLIRYPGTIVLVGLGYQNRDPGLKKDMETWQNHPRYKKTMQNER